MFPLRAGVQLHKGRKRAQHYLIEYLFKVVVGSADILHSQHSSLDNSPFTCKKFYAFYSVVIILKKPLCL